MANVPVAVVKIEASSVSLPQCADVDRVAKLEAEVAELREELEILASRLGYQEQRGKR